LLGSEVEVESKAFAVGCVSGWEGEGEAGR
jgi:hypothetical protein